jgi:chromosomal replication initiator protein
VIYISAETFVNEFIASIQDTKKARAAFKNKYRFVDILLIDDIHFLEKNDFIQNELFYIFNALYNTSKQMVFTSGRPVSGRRGFNGRFRSLVGRGLCVKLDPPCYETRCAILKKKADASGITIPGDVIDLVSKNISTNVRDLESALKTLAAYFSLIEKPVTVGTAHEFLHERLFSS